MSNKKPVLVERVEELAHTSVAECYQCGKCTAGCPRAEAMDLGPTRLIRLVQTGDVLEAASANAPWQCVSCLTCSTRCPKSVNISGVIDALRQISVEQGVTSRPFKKTVIFQKEFLRNIRKNGRTNEIELVGWFKARDYASGFSPTGAVKEELGNAVLGLKMFKRGKLHFVSGSPVKDKAVVERIFEKCGVKK